MMIGSNDGFYQGRDSGAQIRYVSAWRAQHGADKTNTHTHTHTHTVSRVHLRLRVSRNFHFVARVKVHSIGQDLSLSSILHGHFPARKEPFQTRCCFRHVIEVFSKETLMDAQTIALTYHEPQRHRKFVRSVLRLVTPEAREFFAHSVDFLESNSVHFGTKESACCQTFVHFLCPSLFSLLFFLYS